MPLTEITTTTRIPDGGVAEDSERSVRKLYTLPELRDGKHIEDEPGDVIASRVSGAYQRALEWIAEGNSEMWDGLDEIDAYIQPEHYGLAGITFNAKSATYSVGYDRGGNYFALPRDTDIDVPVFLRAMKAFYAGIDYRGKDYAKAESKVVAHGTQIHKIDLRSKDARIAREQGLVVHVLSSAFDHGSDEFDLDYHYDDMSDEFKRDCNEFLSELNDAAMKILRDDYEGVTEEDYILDTAEANEYLFTKEGRIA